ncbi:sugar phosphate isomerase/epimerase family protein [Stutzerimonas tarimensis]|uniref:Sugar phosphate isomerase/epimerase family protein n=1 Tax=Stutzerimonas tarimensis TaxID=1507735 RepID=A0ABV7T2D1_9GAMM
MPRELSLAYLTTEQSPPQALQTAMRTGYSCAGIRLLPSSPGGQAYPLMNDPRQLRETLACQAGTGVRIADLEMIRLDEAFNLESYLRFLEVGGLLQARAVLVAGDDHDPSRLTANFAALCEAALPFGLTADLEFMPWTAVPDLASAWGIVEAANQPNSGVLIDAMHFARSNSTLQQLARIPFQHLHYAQLCDAPRAAPDTVEGLINAARCERLLPGEGGLALAELWSGLPAGLPVSVEVPNHAERARLGADGWAQRARLATLALLEDCIAA